MLYHRLFYSLLLTSISSAIHAQQDMADLMDLSPAELADISVSIASGTLKPVSHSAAVTTVITAEQIASMGATELHEVLETVPGLHATIQPVTNDYSFTMRGMRNETNAEVLLMMNGTRFSVPYQGTHIAGMMIPVENIQRIEVIRGPGSALYGADAFAGVINIITKKAADLDGFTVGARGGNADNESTWGQYGGQWQGWNIATSLQYNHNGIDGSRTIQADAQSQLDAALGTRISLAPGPMQTENNRLNGHLNLQRKHWDLGFWAFNESDFGFRAGTTGALDNKGKGNGSNYLADARYSTEDIFEDWELQAHASFLHTEVDANIYNFPPGTVLPIGQDGNPTRVFNTARPMLFPQGMRLMTGINNTVPSFELTGIYKGLADHLLRMVAGFRYEELTTEESRNYGPGVINPTDSAPPVSLVELTGTPYTVIGNHHRDIWSMALQDEWQLATAWHLTSGIRYDHYSDFGSTWNPRVALVWDISSQLTGKLLYGQAYRAPSFIEQYQNNSPLFIGNRQVRPETIETTELAFDYRPISTLRTALNIYYYEINDLITPNNKQKDTLTVENTPGQDGLGSEFEWDWRFHPNWNFTGNYAWQYARDNASHARVSYVPEHHVYSALAWHFLPKWQIQTQVNWIGHRPKDANDYRSLEDYETIDLTLNAKKLMGYLDLTASVRNLFDANGKEPDITPGQSYPYNLPITAQTFYFEASVNF